MPDARSFYDLERLWQMDAEAAEEAELAQDGR
jgi:ribosomal silencing factor RsfS